MGADKDAAESFVKAEQLLQQAEAYKARKAGTKPVAMTAREAAQTAEDARLITLKRQEEQRRERERQAAADREAEAKAQAARAKAQADEDARLRAQAETEQRLEAERRARAEAQRAAAEAQADLARERALRDQAAADQARQAAARAEAERAAAQAQADLERARALNEQASAEQARQAAARAEREKAELRTTLVQQLNMVLDTRETEHGLVINLSDVLFDSGQYTLRPIAREKLARVSGIVLAHPGLRLQAEGHTDSVGTDDFNQLLSEKRALSVRDFLLEQGLPITSLGAHGFGKTMPVASNDTADGRQRNRRVELVVAGDVIGIPITATFSR
jgi:outer membrane protein OmpA-like peptidoglycan-associated protein